MDVVLLAVGIILTVWSWKLENKGFGRFISLLGGVALGVGLFFEPIIFGF